MNREKQIVVKCQTFEKCMALEVLQSVWASTCDKGWASKFNDLVPLYLERWRTARREIGHCNLGGLLVNIQVVSQSMHTQRMGIDPLLEGDLVGSPSLNAGSSSRSDLIKSLAAPGKLSCIVYSPTETFWKMRYSLPALKGDLP